MSRWAYIALVYALGAAVFGGIQLSENRRFGRAGRYYASAWWVGACWYPLLVYVLAKRTWRALRALG